MIIIRNTKMKVKILLQSMQAGPRIFRTEESVCTYRGAAEGARGIKNRKNKVLLFT